jgi:hypothetical protein
MEIFITLIHILQLYFNNIATKFGFNVSDLCKSFSLPNENNYGVVMETYINNGGDVSPKYQIIIYLCYFSKLIYILTIHTAKFKNL